MLASCSDDEINPVSNDVGFSKSEVTIDENDTNVVQIELSQSLRDDLVVSYQVTTTNQSLEFDSNQTIVIPAGQKRVYLDLSFNDFALTSPEDRVISLEITSVSNSNIIIGTQNTIKVTTVESSLIISAKELLVINTSWINSNNLFDLQIYDYQHNVILSSTLEGNSESIMVNTENLPNGSYYVGLISSEYSPDSSEDITFEFLDKDGNLYADFSEFRVNESEEKIGVFILNVLNDDEYAIIKMRNSN